MKQRLNNMSVAALATPVADAIPIWANIHRGRFFSERGWAFNAILSESCSPKFMQDPQRIDGRTRIRVVVLKDGVVEVDRNSDIAWRYELPILFLRMPNASHTLYNVRFAIDENCKLFDEESARPLNVGYMGVTGRQPFVRFQEHHGDAVKGRGHLLHKAWNSLLKHDVDMHPVFQISGRAPSLKEIYAMEEVAVEKTLAPKGLNVIPGGEAGIRMLHQLRLLGAVQHATAEQRDAALVELERAGGSVATHYRSGHVRRLSAERLTWVNPCWVNLERAA